jgi:tetratricopeptide (TPR) repeat protein
MPVDIRLIAGISCARGAQALNMRNGLYPAAEAVDYVSIYKQIMKNYPDSSSAVYSLMYLGQELFDSNSDEKVTEAFKMFNDFITSYHGNRLYLSPLHLMLADQYIIHRVEYDKAVKHLEECYKIGIANPKNRESAIYRIARIYESRLKSRKNAIKWYRLYLKEYPNSSNSALVKRYLKEMNVKSIEETNG